MKQILINISYAVGVVALVKWGLDNYSSVESGIDSLVAFMATWTNFLSSLI